MSYPNPRRTRQDVNQGPQLLRLSTNMSPGQLKKGATFHTPITPTSPAAEAFRIPPLPRRSQTNLDDVVDGHRRRAALAIDDIERRLAALPTPSKETRRLVRDKSLPVPQGLLQSIVVDPKLSKHNVAMDRRVLRPRQQGRPSARHHASDSGLGTSVNDSKDAKSTGVKAEPGSSPSLTAAINPSVAASKDKLNRLSQKASNRIVEHVLRPLLSKPTLKEFRPIVLDCPRRIQEKEIVCLRDLEQTLLYLAPARAKSAKLYLDFCLTSVRCIQATVEYVHERERTRPADHPYTAGYFITLEDQLREYARQLANTKDKKVSGAPVTDMDPQISDEVKLHGGINVNGRPAELVRMKNGKAYSIQTGEPIEYSSEDEGARFKRSLSQQLEDEEEIARSMARRKKNPTPEELAPKKCKHPGCTKEFKRPCDLTKHEKTHSRPWKCRVTNCKYHELGWPTEKEMERHHNDKHSDIPHFYHCKFPPCNYKSKRESNCKQHMEKAHDWHYVRTKTNGKNQKDGSVAGSATHRTPMIQSMPTPVSDNASHSFSPPSRDAPIMDDPILFGLTHGVPMPALHFGEQDLQLDIDYSPVSMPIDSPLTDASHNSWTGFENNLPIDQLSNDDIYGAFAHIPAPHLAPSTMQTLFPKATTFSGLVDSYGTMAADPPALVGPLLQPISPHGEADLMLYTPKSMADEGFVEEDFVTAGGDFVLYDRNGLAKDNGNNIGHFPSLFGEMPINAATAVAPPGLPQDSQELEWANRMDWNYNSHQ